MSEDPPRGWSIDVFARFWMKPDLSWLPTTLAPDIVGYFPGIKAPVRGLEHYSEVMAAILTVVPDIQLEVAEYAVNDDLNFIRWVARGTGAKGRFELPGVDRIRVRDGLAAENRIFFDTALFRREIGRLRILSRMTKFTLGQSDHELPR